MAGGPGYMVVYEVQGLDTLTSDAYLARLERVRLYETPNCWADAIRTKLD